MRTPIIIDDNNFATQASCTEYTRSVLLSIGETDSVKSTNRPSDFSYLKALVDRHPESEDKLRLFDDFKVNRSAKNPAGWELNIVNNDKTFTSISWYTCIRGTSTPPKTKFTSALRECIEPQIEEFKETTDKNENGQHYCRKCGYIFTDGVGISFQVDHIVDFIKLVEYFLELHTSDITRTTFPTTYDKRELTNQTIFDKTGIFIGDMFKEYHEQHAKLQILCRQCNLTKEKYKVHNSAFNRLVG